MRVKTILYHLVFAVLPVFCAVSSHAAYPGDCQVGFYQVFSTLSGAGTVSGATGFSVGSNGNLTLTGVGAITKQGARYMSVKLFYYQNGNWSQSGGFSYTNIAADFNMPSQFRQIANINQTAVELGTGCPAPPCQQGPGAPIYTGLPYDAQTYYETGICDNGCVAKPAGGVVANDYADDGSGYMIGPWEYTGDQCEAGVTSELPPQPPQEELDDAGDKSCQHKCAGRAYQYDPATGGCECFGAPGVIDAPLDPTVPVPDPGSPTVPGAQTPTADPGGDLQLGAQIANQAKQIGQGDAQLGQLGAINNKLGAVIGNQAKQLGQGGKILDYQRRQLGALEDIRNDLAEEKNDSENPGLPDSFDLDTSVGDSKNWTEHDDPDEVAGNQAATDKSRIPSAPQLPIDVDLQISGTPVLSGVMFGRTVEIRFDRPWMETGYAIMATMLIGIGYLQVFLMVNRTLTNR